MQIVESAALVSLSATEDHDLDPESPADRAVARLPRTITERVAVQARVVLLAARGQPFVGSHYLERLFEAGAVSAILSNCLQCSALEFERRLLRDLARKDCALEAGVSINLGDPDGRVRARCGVVVVPVVHEGLPHGHR